MGRGWKRAGKPIAAPVPYPTTFGCSLANLAALLRMNLFVHREPSESPPELP
jgi:hypothetical protein